MINLRDQYWAVEKHEHSSLYLASNTFDWHPKEGENYLGLPPGTWEIVCTSSPTNLELLHQVVERVGSGFKDYDKDRLHHDLPFMSPIDSLQSLLTSKGCDLNKNYLILKKQ
jgi:hypothetical protein